MQIAQRYPFAIKFLGTCTHYMNELKTTCVIFLKLHSTHLLDNYGGCHEGAKPRNPMKRSGSGKVAGGKRDPASPVASDRRQGCRIYQPPHAYRENHELDG